MIERKENVKIDDYMNAILEHYERTSNDMSIKEYSVDINLNNSMDMAYCRVFVKDCSIVDKEYYYLSFTENSDYDFISNESVFMKFFNENDDVFWRLIN